MPGVRLFCRQIRATVPDGYADSWADGVTFDAEGRCTGAVSFGFAAWEATSPARRPQAPGAAPRHSAPTAAAPAASSGLQLGLPDGRLVVHDDVVRVPLSCSAEMAGELVLLAGSQRIAHKRFTCTPPDEKVRVRLNKAGRKLVADDDRVDARLAVLAGGSTVSRQVLLVSPSG